MKIEAKKLALLLTSVSLLICSLAFAFGKYTLHREFELNKREHALNVLNSIDNNCAGTVEETKYTCWSFHQATLFEMDWFWVKE